MRFVRFALVIVAVVLVGAAAASAGAVNPQTGNGAPSGQHYNLNIHGVAKGQGFDSSSDNQGHNIWVPLWGSCKINLQAGDLDVLNSDCVNGDALFQLPNPADNTTGMLSYSVYARALTKGSASMSACFTDTTIVPNQTFCNVGTLVVPLNKTTPPKFVNVSRQLLQVCVNGSLSPLFSDGNFDYSWQYDNSGLRMAQLRFYPLETTPMGGTC